MKLAIVSRESDARVRESLATLTTASLARGRVGWPSSKGIA